MAITISRTLLDSTEQAVIEVVSTGTVGGETGTIVTASGLNGAAGDELLSVSRVQALVQTGPLFLTWDGDDEATFMTIPAGSTDMSISCSPTDGDPSTITGDILFNTNTESVPFTLRLTVKKVRGFTGSTAIRLNL